MSDPYVPRICERCACQFFAWPSSIKRGGGRYCSKRCANRRPPKDPAQRFWGMVSRYSGDSCWPWEGALNEDGYGNFREGRTSVLAHRYSWELAHGSPGEMYVLHKCDNPRCVNPQHLFLGTQKDNVKDMMTKGRDTRLRGSKAPSAKLTEYQVQQIRALRGTMRQVDIAAQFGVHQTAISAILRTKTWSQVG